MIHRMPLPVEHATDVAERRGVAGLRLVLAGAALAVVSVDPTLPAHHAGLAQAVLFAYVVYSVAIYARSMLARRLESRPSGAAHWIDIAWYVPLVALTGGSSSIFFVLFFFPILISSFRWGFASGMATTLVSSLVFLGTGVATHLVESSLELNRFLLRPVYLLVLGYVIASRGGFEKLLQRRLALLKEIGRLSNPRLGSDRTIGASLEQLRTFYDADDCVLVTTRAGTRDVRLRRATRDDPERAFREDALPADLARQLTALPAERILVCTRGGAGGTSAYDAARGEWVQDDSGIGEAIGEWLGPRPFLTVPVLGGRRLVGRLFVAGVGGRLGLGDADFLLQVVDCLLPLLENVRLVERLAATAADEERQKIARDLHDSIIQPYIGIQIGLSALREQLASAASEGGANGRLSSVSTGVERLLALTESGIQDVRGFVKRLAEEETVQAAFDGALRTFARRFAELTGIAVDVETEAVERIPDPIAAELFQMTVEGLSNARRHTDAKRVLVRVIRTTRQIELSIEDDGHVVPEAVTFTPRSIAGRAEWLEGSTRVERLADHGTRVIVTIPL